ncbi:MAG: hypothetical protein AAGD22_15445 [Verrucomicrobiota bacterium]
MTHASSPPSKKLSGVRWIAFLSLALFGACMTVFVLACLSLNASQQLATQPSPLEAALPLICLTFASLIFPVLVLSFVTLVPIADRS